jgi:hypothetical protein
MSKHTFTTAPVELDPELISIPRATARWSIGRSTFYQAIANREIESISLRRAGKLRGLRLLNVSSVKSWLASMDDGVDEKVSENCRRANEASRRSRQAKKAENGE